LTSPAGFSLVSVVFGLQLIAIAALIAVPKISAYRTQYQLMSASSQLGFEINRARMQAVGQNKWVQIKMLSSTQYARQTSANGDNFTTELAINLPNGLTASPTTGTIRFDKRGIASVNNTIFLTNSVSQVKAITTNVLGRINIG